MQKIIEYFKSLGVDANTTATILLSILTFSIGLFLSWIARQIKRVKEKNSYKKSLVLILKEFSKACEKQDKIVKKSLETFGLSGNGTFVIIYVPIGTLDYLNRLDFNIFLQNFEPYLFKTHFSKAMSKLFELIAQVRIQNETASDFFKQFSEKYAQYEKQYLDNLNELRKIHDSLGVQLDGKKLHKDEGGEFIQHYFEIFGHWSNIGAITNLEVTHKEIVTKVIELLKKSFTYPVVLPINDHALKCDLAYENIKQIEKMVHNKFTDFAHFHRRASKLTTVIIKIIK